MLLEAATEEAREAAQAIATEARLADMLTQVSAGTWQPPATGISLDPYDTVAAALWCATRATSLRTGLDRWCRKVPETGLSEPGPSHTRLLSVSSVTFHKVATYAERRVGREDVDKCSRPCLPGFWWFGRKVGILGSRPDLLIG